MKYFMILWLLVAALMSDEPIKEEQVKVAYTYSLMKNIEWREEKTLDKYRLLVLSDNATLKNMFKMLSSRKKLKDKNIEVLFSIDSTTPPQAIYIDKLELYEKIFEQYEHSNTLIISDQYSNKKDVLINLFELNDKITFEINKANILNRGLAVSPDMILLGGSEIDVAKLYKSSQDELREQKLAMLELAKEIESKNIELQEKLALVQEQKNVIKKQLDDINSQTKTIKEQQDILTSQKDTLAKQKAQLDLIFLEIDKQKQKLSASQSEIAIKELEVEKLALLQEKNEQKFLDTKGMLEDLNAKIEQQKENLSGLYSTVDKQKNIIFMFMALFVLILFLAYLTYKQQRKLKNLSEVDTLSGLYNRRYINAKLDSEIERFKRYQTPLSVILLDIDHFKKINDTYGHDVGDMVIQKISQLLKSSIRKGDIIARWGGEEFLVVVANSNIDGAAALAGKIRAAVESCDFGFGRDVTISLGVASMNENITQDELVKKADEALYKAKEGGRNRIVKA